MTDCDRFKLKLEQGVRGGGNSSPLRNNGGNESNNNIAPGATTTSLDVEREALLKENERLKEYLNQYESQIKDMENELGNLK